MTASDNDPRAVVADDLRAARELAKGTKNEPELLGTLDRLAEDLGLPTGPRTRTREEAER